MKVHSGEMKGRKGRTDSDRRIEWMLSLSERPKAFAFKVDLLEEDPRIERNGNVKQLGRSETP